MTTRTLVRWGGAVTAFCLVAAVHITSARQQAGVPYPTEYRSWAVVKTSLVGPQARNFATRGGFHHFYANDKAMEGYRTGRFPDGSIIVDEGVAAEEAQGVTVEKGRRSLDVMHKDGSRFQATGGWGYDHFDGDSQTSVAPAEARTACFTCHSQRKDHDFVYSTFRR
jgi:hypothetical protein